MTELTAPPQPYAYLRVGLLNAQPVFESIGTTVPLEGADLADVLKNGLDYILLGPQDLRSSDALETLIACEGEGIPTVLRAERVEDLQAPVAAAVSHVVTFSAEVHRSALSQVGSERALLLEPPVDPVEALLEGRGTSEALVPEAVSRRRELIAARSPKALMDRLAGFLGFAVEPEPLVTAVVVSRKAENLDHSLQNLARQQYPRLDVLLTIDPLYEQQARELTAQWEIPVRLVVAQSRSTLADRLNLGVLHALGELVTVFEENALYGPHHITDLVQAVQHSGAQLVGKASWYVYDGAKGRMVPRAAAVQRTYDETPALGTMLLRRETAQRLGFTRRATGTNWPLAERLLNAGASIYSVHAYDTVIPKKGQTLQELSGLASGSEAFPFGSF